MNQTIRQKQAVLQALRDRFALSAAEMYQKIGRADPAREPRFNVVPMGKNTFDIIERATGQSRGARAGHDTACQYADQLEHNADFVCAARATGKRFLRTLLRWIIGMALMLAVFAWYGVQQ